MSEFLRKDESPSKSHIRSTMLPISVENEEASKLGLFVAVCNKPKGEKLLPLLVLAARRRGLDRLTNQPGGKRRSREWSGLSPFA